MALSGAEKSCKRCMQLLPVEQFTKHNTTRDKLSTWCTLCKQKYAIAYRTTEHGKAVFKDYMLRSRHGLTLDAYTKMAEAQGFKCAVCGLTGLELCVDHNHSTSKIRSLLCRPCNSALGYIRESTQIAKALIGYIDKWTEPTTQLADIKDGVLLL